MAKKEKNSFVLYFDQCESAFEDLEAEELSQLWRDIEAYARYGVLPEYPPKTLISTHFRAMSAAIDRNNEKYDARCEQNRKNQLKRWAIAKGRTDILKALDRDEYERIQANTNDTYSDNDNYIENYTEKEKERVSDAESVGADVITDEGQKLMPYSSDQNVWLSRLQKESIFMRCRDINQFLELMEIMSRKLVRDHLEDAREKHYEICMAYMDTRPSEYSKQ